MARQKSGVAEYRNYYLPYDFPVLLLSGEHWKISSVPSKNLHFHNCLEIGVCHSDRIHWQKRSSDVQRRGCDLYSEKHSSYNLQFTRYREPLVLPVHGSGGIIPQYLAEFRQGF